jgi:hypothetical protein
MKHTNLKELLHLSFYGELNDDEQRVLDAHMLNCAECRNELSELKKFSALVERGQGFEITDQLLDEARRELRVALRLEKEKRPFWAGLMDRVDALMSPALQFAMGGAVMLFVGLATGYLFFRTTETSGLAGVAQSVGQPASESSGPKVSNFKFVGQPVQGGDVEFTFELVTPVRMKGSVNDPAIQRVLAQALMSDQNPGARLRTVSTIAEQGDALKSSDTEIKAALIQAVESDPNVGVRKEALQALHRFPLDNEIKNALLFVLKNEGNPAIRIGAISYLQSPDFSRRLVDQDLLNVLKERMKSDDNKYVRTRAQHFYEEVQQQ